VVLAVVFVGSPPPATPRTLDAHSHALPSSEPLFRRGIDRVPLQVTVDDPTGRPAAGIA
jgi:hypothetical protein